MVIVWNIILVMIKPIKISPVNTSKHLEFKCKNCEFVGTLTLTNYIVHTDDNGNLIDSADFYCPRCGKPLKTG